MGDCWWGFFAGVDRGVAIAKNGSVGTDVFMTRKFN